MDLFREFASLLDDCNDLDEKGAALFDIAADPEKDLNAKMQAVLDFDTAMKAHRERITKMREEYHGIEFD